MRLPYVADPPHFEAETDNAIVKRIQERRGDRGLLPLDLALLHAPPVADGWNSFLKAIRTGTTLSATTRELAICRVAALNRAWFEWNSHFPILQKSNPDLITPAVELYILSAPVHSHDGAKGKEIGLGENELAVLAYTDAMTREVEVSQEVWDRLRRSCRDGEEGEREAVEVTATVAAYNCVSRFLVALDVGERNGTREALV